MDERQAFAKILQQLSDYSAYPMIQWESLPDYLEDHENPLLRDYIMYCNPYVGLEETLQEHRSWRLELNGRAYYLLCRDFGYQIGLETEEGIVTFSPPGEQEQEKLLELAALVQAKAEAVQSEKHAAEAEAVKERDEAAVQTKASV